MARATSAWAAAPRQPERRWCVPAARRRPTQGSYCSKGCQKRHWKEGHKAECRKIQIRLDVVGAGAAEAAADASNRACGASDHRNLGFASVSDKEMLDFDQHTFSLGWLIDRKDCRLKHVHGASWIDVVGSTMGSKVAPMTTGKLPDRNGDFVQTATELTESRRSVKIGMMDVFADGHDMFNKGDYRGGMAAANNGAYLSWIACEVSATVQFLILMSSCFTRMVQHTDAVRYAQAAVQATGVEGLRLHDHGIVSFAAASPTSRADLSKDPDRLSGKSCCSRWCRWRSSCCSNRPSGGHSKRRARRGTPRPNFPGHPRPRNGQPAIIVSRQIDGPLRFRRMSRARQRLLCGAAA